MKRYSFCPKYRTIFCLITIVSFWAFAEGCNWRKTDETPRNDSKINAAQSGESENKNLEERPEKIPGLTAEKLLGEMKNAYAAAKIYSDHAYIEAVYEVERGAKSELVSQRWECATTFKKPNFIRLDVNKGVLVSDGENVKAKILDILYENQYLEFPAPLILSSIKELYPDIKLANAMDLGVPASVCWVPPQLVLLLAKDPLKTFVPESSRLPSIASGGSDAKQIKLLEPAYIYLEENQTGEKIKIACDRVEIHADDGTRILWINRENKALARFELPLEQLVVPEDVKRVVSLRVEFPNQVLSEDPSAVAIAKDFFALDETSDSLKVDRFLPPELFMLGKQFPDVSFRSLVSGFSDLKLDASSGKNHLICFWGGKNPEAYADIWEKSKAFLVEMERANERFADDSRIDFLAVNFDIPQCSDNMVRNFFGQVDVSLPLYRLDVNEAQKTFLTGIAVPSVMILDENGIVQKYYQTPVSFVQIYRLVQFLLNKNSLYLEDLRSFDANTKLFLESLNAADANDVYYIDPDASLDEKATVASPAPFKNFELQEVWRFNELRGFGNPLTVSVGANETNALGTSDSKNADPATTESNEDVADDESTVSIANDALAKATDYILVPCEGNALALLNAKGELLKKVVPQAANEPISFVRTGLGEDGSRYFAASSLLESQKVHRFDSQLNDLGSLDVGRLKGQWVADVRFADVDRDRRPELLLALIGDSSDNNLIPVHGIYAVDMKSQKVLWRDEMILTPYQIGVQSFASDESPSPETTESGETAAKSETNSKIVWAMNHPEGLTGNLIGDRLETGDRVAEIADPENESILWLNVDDLDRDGESEIVVFLAKIDPPGLSFAGLKSDGTVLWRYPLPQQYQGRQMERVLSGDVDGDGVKEWILPTADGCVRIIDRSGNLIDEYFSGTELTGVSVATWNGRPHLILTDRDKIVAYEIRKKP